ncbi:MAG: hypothetical protein LC745_06255, partial [Planctomycetia bacterium]|nr:hypothetical protein [Planctomycetia bacterium]
MATATRTPPSVPADTQGIRPYPITVPQFLKMIVAGVFPEGARVELLGGVLAEQMTKYAPHNFCVGRLAEALRGIAAAGWFVSEEKSVVLGT